MKTYNDNTNKAAQYKRAKERVKKIKSFYFHLAVYLAFNIYFATRAFLEHGVSGIKYSLMGVGFFWGIGLLFHWYNTFGKNLFFSKEWEERKINELLNN